MKKFFLNLKGIQKVCVALLTLTSVVILSSCSKDPVEIKQVQSDGTVIVSCLGYSISSSTGAHGTGETVPGVVIKLKNGQSFTSDANGLMTITLPAGEYLYRVEAPGSWKNHERQVYNQTTYTWTYEAYNLEYEEPDWWTGTLKVSGAFTRSHSIRVYK